MPAPNYHSNAPPTRSGSYLVIAETAPGRYDVQRERWDSLAGRWGWTGHGTVLAWAEVPDVPASTAALRIITRLSAEGRSPRDPVIAAASLSRAMRAEAACDDVAARVEAAAAVEEYLGSDPWWGRSAVAKTGSRPSASVGRS